MNLNINNLQKYYEGQPVLNIENLTIQAGSLLGIIGPNGAGKSTLIKTIAGLIKASSGSIYYDNNKFSSKIQKHMTLVFQKPYLLRSTVFNNIAYPLKIRNVERKEIEKRVIEVMDFIGIESLKNQKVALARAIVIKPSLLLLDEPTANIDPNSILVMEEAIKKFHKENNSTVIIITHNLGQSKRLCKEVAFMNKGKIIEIEKTDRLFNSPKHSTTKKFIEGEIII